MGAFDPGLPVLYYVPNKGSYSKRFQDGVALLARKQLAYQCPEKRGEQVGRATPNQGGRVALPHVGKGCDETK
ncbi:MAG: hypothetical protein H8E44_47545 [Planctomycetes bacterium]|nr:hypothetical protein [Planctomycetota bacterium]